MFARDPLHAPAPNSRDGNLTSFSVLLRRDIKAYMTRFIRVDFAFWRGLTYASHGRHLHLFRRPFLAEEFLHDWKFAQKGACEELAQLHHFSFKKQQAGAEITFLITVKEFVTPPEGQFARFFAQADKEVNQKTAPILPTGWGASLLDALSDCTRMIRDFPYEGKEALASRGSAGT
jgi:hypothetical protein